jgi:hypothetical protein
MPFAEDWKFRSIDGGAECILESRELWFSTPEHFNDPFDCQVDIKGTFDAIRNSLLLRHEKEIASLIEGAKLHAEIHRYAYFCACGGWDETLMWSHYADGHRGVALWFEFSADSPFNFRELTYKPIDYSSNALSRAIESSNDALNLHRAYPNNYPGMMEGEAEQFFEIFHSNIVELFEAIRFMKAECWKYEREQRYELELSPEQLKGVSRPFAPGDLKHVIFGVMCQDETVQRIQGLLSAPEWNHVHRWRAVRDAVNLKIVAEPMT